jgi:hypothetical protein
VLAFCLVLASSAAVAAQQVAPAPAVQPKIVTSDSDPQLAQLKSQLRQFEVLMKDSLNAAAQRFSQWARQIEPSVFMTPAAHPVVQSIALPDESVALTVQTAEIVGSQMFSVVVERQRSQPSPSSPAGNGSNVASGPPRVQAQGILVADPMTTATDCSAVTPAPIDPSSKYSECVREAIINSMLDHSRFLTIKPGRWLTVEDIPIDVALPGLPNPSKKLILSIRGEDLTAFHDGKITRDEAKLRIVEKRF